MPSREPFGGLAIGFAGLLEPALERDQGILRPPEREQRAAGGQGPARLLRPGHELRQSIRQAHRRLRLAGDRLRPPELEDQVRAHVARWRLVESTPEIPNSIERLRAAKRHGSSHGQRLDRRRAAHPGREQEVFGHTLGSFTVLGQDARDAQVPRGPLTCRLRGLDGRRDRGLREGQALAGCEKADIDQPVDGFRGRLDVELRHRACVTHLAVRPQHCEGTEQGRCAGGRSHLRAPWPTRPPRVRRVREPWSPTPPRRSSLRPLPAPQPGRRR